MSDRMLDALFGIVLLVLAACIGYSAFVAEGPVTSAILTILAVVFVVGSVTFFWNAAWS